MMTKRLLLLRHASRPPSCLLYRHYDVCRSINDVLWLKNRVGQRKFASLASNNNRDDDYSKSHQSASTATSPSTSTDSNSDRISISSTLKNSSSSSNANPNEVYKFSSFAAHWWDSRSNPLVGMNPIRIKFLREVVDNFQPSQQQQPQQHLQSSLSLTLPLHNKRILDIGCGGGLLTESLSRLGANLVVGLDASTHVVDVARTHSFHEYSRLVTSNNIGEEKNKFDSSAGGGHCGIQYIGGMTLEEFASTWTTSTSATTTDQQATPSSIDNPQQQQQQNNELFDIITALEIIEHVPNPSSLLHAAQKLLKPNGILFVSTINRTVKSYGMAIVAAEYILGKVPVGTHSWDMFWSPDEVEQMILCGGGSTTGTNQHYHGKEGDRATVMKQIALSGMVLYPPFINMEWMLDRNDTDVNWIGAYQKQQV